MTDKDIRRHPDSSSMSGIDEILSAPRFSKYTILKGQVPVRDEEAEIRCRKLCETNECGDYGATWACPPSFTDNLDSMAERFTRTLVMKRTFFLCPTDKEAVASATGEMQEDVRAAVQAIRSTGADCMGFADGRCRYCGTCAHPEPCRFPEALVPSISALGLSMGDYLPTVGESLGFSDDKVTFYGLLFIRD